MKKLISLGLIAILVLPLSGCKKQAGLESSSFELSDIFSQQSTTPAVNQEESIQTSTEEAQLQAETKPSTPAVQQPTQKPTQQPAGCAHDYRGIAVGVSCTTDGHMQYTCTKCGHSYNGESLPAGHDFGKYLCEGCGKIDPQCDVFWGMNAFLTKYGTPNGKGNMNCYPNDTSLIMVSNNLDQKQFYVSYEDTANGESISVRVDEGFSSITFRKNANCGFMDIKNSAFSLEDKIVFDDFATDPSDPVDVDVFATECAAKLKTLFQRAENEILIPKTGLTFENFGFRI